MSKINWPANKLVKTNISVIYLIKNFNNINNRVIII